jgi:hypothetical protein
MRLWAVEFLRIASALAGNCQPASLRVLLMEIGCRFAHVLLIPNQQ